MKAAYVRVPFRVEIRELPVPEIRPEELLIRVSACGICGSDLHLARTLARDEPRPLGHEFCGVVEAVGACVGRFEVGDAVVVESNTSLGTSRAAKNGRLQDCTDLYVTFENPCMAELVKTHHLAVHHRGGLSAVEGALVEPLIVALDLVETGGGIPFGGNVAVFGGGPIGLMALRIARARGARKLCLTQPSHSRARIELARTIGCDRVVLVDQEDPVEALRAECPEGFDRVFVTSPPETVPAAFEIAAYGGIVTFNGMDFERFRISFDANSFHFKRLQLRASHNFPNLRAPLAIELLRDKVIDAADFVTHRFPLAQTQKAMETAAFDKEHVIKVIVDINPETGCESAGPRQCS